MTRTNSQEKKSSTCISIKNKTNKNRQKNVSTQKAQNVTVMQTIAKKNTHPEQKNKQKTDKKT